MNKRFAAFFVFFFALSVLYGQNSTNAVSQLDDGVKTLAAEIQKKIPAGGSPKIAVGQWVYRNSVPALGIYWAAQLTGELANVQGRSFILPAGESGAPDWSLAGEIIESAGVIRVYTRLIRSADHSIAASFHTDFSLNEHLAGLLSGGGGSMDMADSSRMVARDAYEPDSLENPLAVDIAANDSGPVINRTLHNGNDEDFFLLAPDKDGALTVETTGDLDTCLELYNTGSGDKLADDDDGGSSVNARIRYAVRTGNRYIVKVRGYDSSEEGNYGLRVWLVETAPDEYENDNDFDAAKAIDLGTAQQHTFTTGDDVDWVQFQIREAGRYTIRARGVISTWLDTSIELYDGDQNAIGDDDDGGEEYDSRLSRWLQAGTYYLKVICLDRNPDEPYTITVTAE
jgi:hypothetical protein